MAAVYLTFGQNEHANKVLQNAAEYGVKMTEAERAQIIIERDAQLKPPKTLA